MILNEDQKTEILSRYTGDTSDKVLTNLKRNFPVYDFKLDWINEPIKQMLVDGKLIHIKENKKYLVKKIFPIIQEKFPEIEENIIRRTIKKYIDGVS